MNSIVADGRGRLRKARRDKLEQRARMWFADDLGGASWWRRQIILWRIRRQIAVIVRKSEPSSRTLW